LEADLLAFQAIALDVPRGTLQQDLQQAVANHILLDKDTTHRERYRPNNKTV
jgi:hypothetical protein